MSRDNRGERHMAEAEEGRGGRRGRGWVGGDRGGGRRLVEAGRGGEQVRGVKRGGRHVAEAD